MKRFSIFAALMVAMTFPAIAAPLVVESAAPIAIGTSIRFASLAMKQERSVNIYLPADYATNPDRRYPVLYVIDGGVAQDFLHIIGLAHLGGLSGMYPDMIVVGIETVDRRNELTTQTTRADYLKDFPTLGGGARFRSMIADEVIPYIDANYRVGHRRVVIGESLAAYFIVDTFLKTPALFTDYIAITPSMWWDGMALAKTAPSLLTAHPAGPRSLYLTVADEGGDHRQGNDMLAAAVRAAGSDTLRFIYTPRDGEEHSTIYHGAALDALRWTFRTEK